ncbi:MAG TPA: hypothetical protein PLR07_09830, partial [Promineifilum sp.]|nr:hypothetical protein [Promineifilum sp.]
MKWKVGVLTLLLLITTVTAACSATAALRDSRPDAPSTATPSPTNTPAPVTEDPAGYARAFYRAWEMGDYLGMYSLLTPSSQVVVDSASFIRRYEEAMRTAAVSNVHAQPLGVL